MDCTALSNARRSADRNSPGVKHFLRFALSFPGEMPTTATAIPSDALAGSRLTALASHIRFQISGIRCQISCPAPMPVSRASDASIPLRGTAHSTASHGVACSSNPRGVTCHGTWALGSPDPHDFLRCRMAAGKGLLSSSKGLRSCPMISDSAHSRFPAWNRQGGWCCAHSLGTARVRDLGPPRARGESRAL
jgi:hypothetical protein